MPIPTHVPVLGEPCPFCGSAERPQVSYSGHEYCCYRFDRVFCPDVGTPGHGGCGWCAKHDRPMAECDGGCVGTLIPVVPEHLSVSEGL